MTCAYLHVLDGRLRVKIPELKQAQAKAAAVGQAIESLSGVTHVSASTITGSILILFDPQRVHIDEILAALRQIGILRGTCHMLYQARGQQGREPNLTEKLVWTALETAVRRLLTQLM